VCPRGGVGVGVSYLSSGSDHLSIEWKSVLPVCQNCRADGAIPLARSKRRNGAVNGKRAERDRVTADVPEANVDDVSPMVATGMPPATTSTAPRTTKRGRRVDLELVGKRSRRRVSRRVQSLHTI
jgi:hypothetical protein